MSNRLAKIVIFLFPIVLFLIFLCTKIASPRTYVSIIQEDSLMEYAQALFYFLASVSSLFLSISFLKNRMVLHGTLYCILTLGLVFVCLEEISWGQRIIGFKNTDYFSEHNVQNETSIHNLDTVQPLLINIYILVGAYGAFAWIFVWLFVPKSRTECSHIANFVVPEWFTSSYFFFVFFVYVILEHVRKIGVRMGIEELRMGDFLVWRDQEPVELLLSLGFLSFVVVNYIKLRVCLTIASTRT